MDTTPRTDALRARIDAAIRPTMLLGLQDAELHDAPGAQRIGEWVDWISETVAAALAEDRATHAARGQADERRDRYAAAIQRNVTDGIELNSILPEVYDAADAAMAVADQELAAAARDTDTACEDGARLEADIARLRKEAAEEKAAKEKFIRAFDTVTSLRSAERAHAAEVRAAALTEAADFLRDAHFRDGMSVQEIGTALRHTAAAARPDDTRGA